MTTDVPSGSHRVAHLRPRVIALGSEAGSDDRAALEAARRIEPTLAEVVIAGRPGPSLLDWLDPDIPTVLVDVVRHGVAPGQVTCIPLAALTASVADMATLSSHGLGPANALRLARALGRELPIGWFVGVGGVCFEPGTMLSPAVRDALPTFTDAIRARLLELWEDPACTTTASSPD